MREHRLVILLVTIVIVLLWTSISRGQDIEIIDVQMREIQRYDIFGVEISWRVRLANNTDTPRRVFVKVYFLDGEGFKLDDDIQEAVLAPNTVTAVTDTAFIQPEIYSQIRSIKVEF